MNHIKEKINDIRSFIELPNLDLNKLNLRTNNKNLIHDVHQQAGTEHYRLLCLLSTWFNDIVIYELGTWLGAGALSLAYNKTNRVISYDVEYNVDIIRQSNLEFRIGDYKNDKQLLLSPFIFVDVMHNGFLEKEIYDYLVCNKYNGFTVWSGINLNTEMREFWKNVSYDKVDITRYGHYSGTGIIFFQ